MSSFYFSFDKEDKNIMFYLRFSSFILALKDICTWDTNKFYRKLKALSKYSCKKWELKLPAEKCSRAYSLYDYANEKEKYKFFFDFAMAQTNAV